ncbi:hypothetical protein AKJ60_00885 [candidate division MSBL1 archaeon SCGC-AAA385M11]|nr:hypothetical protein AKJ60_00885 [candidate division MSBL1 archaeon SCGC-AAA385M11]
MEDKLIIRGQVITPEVLNQIQSVIQQNWSKGRKYISKELCRAWNWRQENGFLKDQVCRILLRKLESRQLITLPPSKNGSQINRNRRYFLLPETEPDLLQTPMEGRLDEFPTVTLKMVRHSPEEPLWNYLVHQFHYQSLKIIVGAHLKYLACIEDRPVACLAWNSTVFRINCRDEHIHWDPEARNKNIRHVVNNSRFLIFPWVRIKNLASHLLALSAKTLARDWNTFYGYPLYLLETFVDRSRFAGTCYQAANWLYIGQTKGHAKKNGRFYYHGQKKDVYIYPLVPDFKDHLCAGGAK